MPAPVRNHAQNGIWKSTCLHFTSELYRDSKKWVCMNIGKAPKDS